MTRTEFRTYVRFMFGDTDTSNTIYREPLSGQPRNVIDGNNTVFFLLNRRITQVISVYDSDNAIEIPANFVLDAISGRIDFVTPPKKPLYADYSWQKLTDAELDKAIDLAASSGNFDPNNVTTANLDYAAKYATAYCFQFATSHASEYYTISAGGKQVSKSELFNHFYQMYEKLLGQAENLRRDQRTDRGDRDVPADGDTFPEWVEPYFPNEGGSDGGGI